MKRFKRRGSVISSHLSDHEVELLKSLIGQFVEMVSDGEPGQFTVPEQSADPFATWAKDFQAEPDQPETPEDPVLQRLFPNAYPHDPDASSDFRRFTERDLKTKKIAEARVVLRALAETENGSYPVLIATEDANEWLRTLTNLRLAVAIRLGITDEEAVDELSQLPDDDPRSFMLSVYDWLGFAQETLISAL